MLLNKTIIIVMGLANQSKVSLSKIICLNINLNRFGVFTFQGLWGFGLIERYKLDDIDYITDESELLDILRTTDNLKRAEYILAKIKSQDSLKKIVNGWFPIKIKKLAIGKIDDKEFLVNVVRNSDSHITRDDDGVYYESNDFYPLRSDAVAQINDQQVLADAAMNDPDSRVCSRFTYYIKDTRILKDIALNHRFFTVRSDACERIHDQQLLKTIALRNEDSTLCLTAVKNIESKDVLVEIAKKSKFPEVIEYILKQYDGDPCVKDIVQFGSNQYLRREAIELIYDNDVLEDIALNELDKEVRIKAIRRIFNEDILIGIAKTDSDEDIRRAAVNNNYLIDSDTLKFVAKNDSKERIRYWAIHKLAYGGGRKKKFPPKYVDDVFYFDIAKTDLNSDIRLIACDAINNQEYLEHILHNDNDREVRRTAVYKITDRDVLEDIALNDHDEQVRSRATHRFGEYIGDDDVLAKIAKTDNDAHVREVACRHIKSISVRKDIIYNEKNFDVIRTAFWDVFDYEVLLDIFLDMKDPFKFRKAFERITDYVSFIKVVEKASGGIQHKFFGLIDSPRLVELVNDEDFLMDIFDSDFPNTYRFIANRILIELKSFKDNIDEITDENTLYDLVLNDNRPHVRYKAVCNDNLADESLLFDIALRDDDKNVRLAAASKISNEEYLADIIKENWDDNYICDLVISKIHDESILGELLKTYSGSLLSRKIKEIKNPLILCDLAKKVDFSLLSTSYLIEEINDDALLADIAKNGDYEKMRMYAALKMSDQSIMMDIYEDIRHNYDRNNIIIEYTSCEELLIDVALNEPTFRLRGYAVENEYLTNQEVLSKVALYDDFSGVRARAVEKINDIGVLKRIASEDDSNVVVDDARERIRYLEYFRSHDFLAYLKSSMS